MNNELTIQQMDDDLIEVVETEGESLTLLDRNGVC
jgi:hypothetical protein